MDLSVLSLLSIYFQWITAGVRSYAAARALVSDSHFIPKVDAAELKFGRKSTLIILGQKYTPNLSTSSTMASDINYIAPDPIDDLPNCIGNGACVPSVFCPYLSGSYHTHCLACQGTVDTSHTNHPVYSTLLTSYGRLYVQAGAPCCETSDVIRKVSNENDSK